jgi:hypothetical protein
MKKKLIAKLTTGLGAILMAAVLPMVSVAQVAALSTCPTTESFSARTPYYPYYSDNNYVSVGTKFQVRGAPYVTGAVFFNSRSSGNTVVVHVGTLGGESLASKSFNTQVPSEAPPGWASVTFDDPVPVKAGVDYIVWVSLPSGNYSVDPSGTDNSFYNRSFGDAESAMFIDQGNSGYYKYTSDGTEVPNNAVAHNYNIAPRVDDEIDPGDVASFDADDNAAGPVVAWDDAAFDSNDTYEDEVHPTYTDVFRTANSVTTRIARYAGDDEDVSFNDATALPGTTYTYSAKSTDACGNVSTGTSASNFTTSSQSLEKLFSTDPANTDTSTDKQVLGMHWETSTAGNVWGGRIYRAANTWPTDEPMKVTLWDNDGTPLASTTLQQSSDQSGWIDVRFSSPVSVSANHDYVIGYYTSNGQNVYTTNVFDMTSVSNGSHLTGRQDTISTYNGVYDQDGGTSSSSFPADRASNGTWYGIDVDFYIP